MKFGQNFHLYQVPEWEPFYIPYNSLKRLFSRAVRKAEPDFAEVYRALDGAIDVVDTFHREKYNFLNSAEADLCKVYGLTPDICVALGTDNLDYYELGDILKAFLELRKDFKRLQWYDRVNKEAIHRIFAKLDRSCGHIGQLYHDHKSRWDKLQLDCETPYLKHVEKLSMLVANITLIYSSTKSGSTGRSLLLETVCRQHSPFLFSSTDLYCAIRDDEPAILANLLAQKPVSKEVSKSYFQDFLYGLLAFSVACDSRKSAHLLISEVMPQNGVLIDYHCLNHIIAVSGRSGLPAHDLSLLTWAQSKNGDDTGSSLFLYALNQLGHSQKDAFLARDTLGRRPLHYGVIYGLTAVCQSILNFSQEQGYTTGLILSFDIQGYTPLHYAVIHNHKAVARLFLETIKISQTINETSNQTLTSLLRDILFIALRYQNDDIVYLLGNCHFDIDYRSSHGETALYVAARLGREDYVKMFLKTAPGQNVHIDAPEALRGWTPLFIACTEGHLEVVKLLLQAGANQDILDHHGWTAQERAAFRGHLTVATTLKTCKLWDFFDGPSNKDLKPAIGAKFCLGTGKRHIIVNLGTTRKGNQVRAVDLIGCSSETSMYMDHTFTIEVSLSEGSESSYVVQLPILSDMVNEPFVFPVKEFCSSLLTFKLFRASPSHENGRTLVGRGTALLEDPTNCFGANRESLIRERTIPILEKEVLNFMGTVTFTYVIANPFEHSASSASVNHYPTEAGRLQVVGHRGLGQNVGSHRHLQLRENTRESFLSAAKLGASFVEFDVQLTRDLVPIIYHDLSLSESGTDIPIHDLSLDQFMYASEIQSPRGRPVPFLERTNVRPMWANSPRGKPRSRSLTMEHEYGAREIQNRVKHTVDYMKKGFKPNTRGDFIIHGSFATLEELLVELPKSISFDIEIKYPRLHEAVDAGVAPIAIEINTFIDEVLEKVWKFGNGRTIVLSSFSPEVCILLAIKQRTYPIMFITNAGKPPMMDLEMRASSLQVAVRFAKRWNLAGIVFASEVLVLCPRLVAYVKNYGLTCGSYGPQNNIPEYAKAQADAGLEVIMTDMVGLMSKALNSPLA